MRGLKSEDLVTIGDFLFFGEANVYHENLESFLAVAEELKLKGLCGNEKTLVEEATSQTISKKQFKGMSKKEPTEQNVQTETDELEPTVENILKGTVAVTDFTRYSELQELDEQIKSMMDVCENDNSTSIRRKVEGIPRVCKVCNKVGKKTDIKRHIEAHHITGITHPCSICGKESRSRQALRMHMSRSCKQ